MAFRINIYGCQPYPKHGHLWVNQLKNHSFRQALYIVVLGIFIFISVYVFTFHILFGLLYPFSIWTFISLFYLDFFNSISVLFRYFFNSFSFFLFYRGHILDFFHFFLRFVIKREMFPTLKSFHSPRDNSWFLPIYAISLKIYSKWGVGWTHMKGVSITLFG